MNSQLLMDSYLLIFGAGLLAGTMNALSGGGSFITLPALISAGIPSVQANASSTIGGYCGAVVGKRIPSGVIRTGTLLIATCITVIFLTRAYGHY
jgi:uncharacterized membrane protein YfcA